MPTGALVAAALAIGCAPANVTDAPGTDMDGDSSDRGQLTSPVELRDAQSGFAGVSGTVVRIEPDGGFTVSRFLNDTTEPPHQRGRLASDELERLARLLLEVDFLGLEPELGEPPPLNPRIVTVTVGDSARRLYLEPGVTIAAAHASLADSPERPEARLLAVAHMITTLTQTR